MEGVQLSITKQQVENLPPVDIDQPGGQSRKPKRS